MKRKILLEMLIVIGVFVAGWLFFSWLKINPSPPDLSISIEQEEKLADVLVSSFLDDQEEVADPVLDSAMYVISSRLMDSNLVTDYEYTFHIIRSKQVNAFAILGGHVFITTGIIQFSETPEELAAVIAHEIGHIEKRHVLHKLAKELGVTLLFSIASGGDPVLVSEVMRQSISTVFDRAQEEQADDFALDLMEKSGIHPESMASFFLRIKSEYGSVFEDFELLMTHPNTNSRIKKAVEYNLKEGFEKRKIELDWERVKAAATEPD